MGKGIRQSIINDMLALCPVISWRHDLPVVNAGDSGEKTTKYSLIIIYLAYIIFMYFKIIGKYILKI